MKVEQFNINVFKERYIFSTLVGWGLHVEALIELSYPTSIYTFTGLTSGA